MSFKSIVTFLFISPLLSCKTSHFETWASKKEMKEIYTPVFKLTYFKKLLVAGYNNSSEIKNVVYADYSGFSEPILTEDDYNLIDSLIRIDNNKMKQDSINRIGRVAEGAEGKHVLIYTLGEYQSKWLDKLAKERFKIYWRKEKKSYEQYYGK